MTSSSNGQLSSLSVQRRFITTHNAETKAIVHSAEDFQWQAYDGDKMGFSVVYSTSQSPPDLNGDADIRSHEALTKKGTGLVNPNGSVLRCVDFAPGYRCGMHRTQSLDYGIVLEGEIDMLLDSGEVHHMKAGDVAVQRATNHQWLNRSDTKWARMIFVLQDCQPLNVGGQTMSEDLGKDLAFLPSSR
ncbi:hypothetical protein GQ53DRAFT_671936 [Thozetella sp. PMI_491]|nr:hypothetical protein GQ53DRAFT_671936 [Thozetella sp. PMI_491]